MIGGARASLALVLGGLLLGPLRAQAPPAPVSELVASRERSFRVPFKLDPLEKPRLQAVQLYYSTDRGTSWKLYSSARPDDGSFAFAARDDGEIWFAVRTVDREGRMYPPTLVGVGPELRVLVDSTPPQITLRALTPVGDQVGIEWSIVDENLDLSTFRAEFRPESSNSWFPVPVEVKAQGRALWRPGVQGPIVIRLRVSDRAGNEEAKELVLKAAGGIPAFGQGQRPPADTAARGEASTPGEFRIPDRPSLAPLDPLPGQGARPLSSELDRRGPAAPPLFQEGVPLSNSQQGRPIPWNPSRSGSDAPPSRPAPARTNSDIEIQRVNSLEFGIRYDISEVGKSGVESVELFFTIDQGRTWESYGVDDDKKIPPPGQPRRFLVKVSGEGLYGFIIIAKSGAGFGPEPPSPGDPPQVWVEVDVEKPDVRFTSAPQVGRDTSAGILGISWTAQDRNLAPKSIKLLYSENANAKWKTIAEGLDNTGNYQWKMPENIPFKFYLRVEARDLAGNVGYAETDQPVIVDLKRPKSRITGVEPAQIEPLKEMNGK